MVLMRLSCTLCVLFFCLAALAQSPLGTVTGLVTDPSGSPVPGVSVTLTSSETGIRRETATNSAGNYLFPNLQPGNYTLSVAAKGFKKVDLPRFPLDAYKTVRQDLPLTLETSTTEITVTESASTIIATDTPSVTTGLTTRQILDLPTNLRSVYNNSGDSGLIANIMPLTIPGVVQMGSGAYWLVPGGGPNGTRLKVDGIETNFGNFGSPDPVSQPSMESVQEFTANLVTNKAEFNGLGAVTTVTKSGTNQFHGDVFWYAKNAAFDARNTFLTARPFQNIHNYGISGGGPLRKDKTFLFGTWDDIRGVRAYAFASNVPTLAQRGGNFGSATVVDPYNNNAPFPNNIIPDSRIAAEAKRAQDLLYPLPNYGPPSLAAGNYRAGFNGPETHHILEGRLDHNLTSGHSVFVRYQWKKDDYRIPGARSALPPTTAGTSTNLRQMHFWTVGDIWAVRPNMFNEFRGGLVVLASGSYSDINGQDLLNQIGVQGLPPRPYAPGVPNFSVSGLTTYTQSLLNPVNDGHWQLGDNFTWVQGRHTMKFGVEMVRWFVNRYLNTNAALFGNFSFQNRFTRQPYGDFLMGLPTTVTRLDPFLAQYFRWNDFAFYAQDDFKVTRSLTLSYGLRYELNLPASARDNNFYSYDPGTRQVVIPAAASRNLFSPYFPATLPVTTADTLGLDNTLRKADSNNWAPRFGFSYQLDSEGKTVVRGGAGVYFGHYSVQALSSQTAGPFAVSTTSTNSFVNSQPAFTLRNPFAAPGSSGTLNLNGLEASLRNAYSTQYSLSVERQVVRDLAVRVSYIGTKGSQIPYLRNINQPPASSTPFAQSRRPNPLYNNIVFAENGANNSYHGLQVGVTKRFYRGFQLASTYIWAKQLSEVDDTGNAELNIQIEDAYNRARDKANVYSVPRYQWMNNVIWDLPLGKGPIRGGWQLNALLNLSSGNWLNPLFSGSDPSNTNTVGGRPDLRSPIIYPETQSNWYDRSVFGVPTGGRFGNAGRNIVEGPGYIVFNAGASKTFQFEKIGGIQVGASFQNVLNHVNLGQPNMTVNVAQGGSITSTHVFLPAGSPRTGQLSLRWRF